MKHNIPGIIFLLLMTYLLSCSTGGVKAVKSGEKIKLYYEGTAQVELISSKGSRVLIDVRNPAGLSSPPTKDDVLLTTHDHYDHINSDFISSFPGRQLYMKEGMIKLDDVVIVSIPSAHNNGDELKPVNGTNYIFIIDMAGLRIAHFGDIGQEALTSNQLSSMGKVDIAIMQLENPFSGMNADNKKAFNLMDQVKPSIIMPTHLFGLAFDAAVEKWDARNSHKKFLSISTENLPKKTQIIFMDIYANHFKLPESDL